MHLAGSRAVIEGSGDLTIGSEVVTAAGLAFLGGRVGVEHESPKPGPESFFTRPVKEQLGPIYSGIQRSLSELKLDLNDLIRVDAAVVDRDHVSSYREQRPLYLRDHLPTSTVVHVAQLAHPDAVVQLTPIAINSRLHGRTRVIDSSDMTVHSPDAFSKGLRSGDWLFVSGATASAHSAEVKNPYGLAEAAVADDNYWAQSAIKLQTRFVLGTKILGVLRADNFSRENIVRANIYLTDMSRNLGPFLEEWIEQFEGEPPATVLFPVDGLGLRAARVEISVIAFGDRAQIKRIGDPTVASIPGCPVAVRAGGLLWFSAIGGVYPEARRFESSSSQVVRGLEAVLRSTGKSLDDLVSLNIYSKVAVPVAEAVDHLRSATTSGLPAISATKVASEFFDPYHGIVLEAVAVDSEAVEDDGT